MRPMWLVMRALGVEKRQENLEHAKVSIRAKVEYCFHIVKNLFMHSKTRYKGMTKNNTSDYLSQALGLRFVLPLFA